MKEYISIIPGNFEDGKTISASNSSLQQRIVMHGNTLFQITEIRCQRSDECMGTHLSQVNGIPFALGNVPM